MEVNINDLLDQVEKSDISSTRAVLCRIMEVINNPNSSAFDLKNMIEMDPPLAARVLKRANSAFYGLNRRMAEILDAIVCIGFEAIRELALNQTVCELFKKDDVVHGYSRSSLWVHCVATALCGKLICRREFQMPGEHVYTVGLLHDIGIIVEDQFLRKPFTRVLENLNRQPELGLYECERREFGFTHADLGEALARRWNFPESLCRAIGAETAPDTVDTDETFLMSVLCVARWACQGRQIGYVETPKLPRQLMRDTLHRLNVTEQGLAFVMDAVQSQIEQMRNEGWF